MKYKKKLKKLEGLQRAWDNLPSSTQKATTRPGSVKAI